MLKPTPPPRAGADITKIAASTWNRLVACLEYAMTHPDGDGRTIRRNRAGRLTALARGGGTAGSGGGTAKPEYGGAFKIALSADGNYQVIDGRQPDSPYCGMALIGIYSWTVPKTALGPLQSGSIYVGWSAILKGMEVRTNSDAIYPQLEIGRFADGVLIQLYQGGDMVIPGWIYLS